MTFARISALCELINRYKSYKGKASADSVVIIISFDILSELKTRCVKSMSETIGGEQYFMGCRIFMSHSNNYLAVAYLNELEENFHDIIEITDEEAKNDK